MNTQKPGLSYKDAGVDIDAGESLIEKIKPLGKIHPPPGRRRRAWRVWRGV